MDRNDIYIVSRHSNLNEKTANNFLNGHVYNDASSWKKFLHIFFIVLGIGFTATGIIFFFAYNWDSLHKFAKMGILQVLIIAATIVALRIRSHILVKKSILTGAAILVGALFAVHGQIYQTGANAYDFFLAWTFSIVIWAAVANFAPLWLLLVGLANTTIYLYFAQIARDAWPIAFICLLVLNAAALILFVFISSRKSLIDFPNWFRNLLALSTSYHAIAGLIFTMYTKDDAGTEFVILLLLTVILCGVSIWYGNKIRSIFFFAMAAFTVMSFVSASLLKVSVNEAVILFISLVNMIGIPLLNRFFYDVNKQWNAEIPQAQTIEVPVTDTPENGSEE
ncbi:MAG: DUF2157 domain-containing protein [Proteobacteria bacterium]|nr:DUF2157 domain-containing protein [Pseudomonadota bacterium]